MRSSARARTEFPPWWWKSWCGNREGGNNDAAIGRAYNISGRDELTQRQMMSLYAEAAGLEPLTRTSPEWLAMAISRTFEGAYRLMRRKDEPYLTRIAVVIAGRDYQIDCSRAAAELGWAGSADYGDAIQRSMDWLRNAG